MCHSTTIKAAQYLCTVANNYPVCLLECNDFWLTWILGMQIIDVNISRPFYMDAWIFDAWKVKTLCKINLVSQERNKKGRGKIWMQRRINIWMYKLCNGNIDLRKAGDVSSSGQKAIVVDHNSYHARSNLHFYQIKCRSSNLLLHGDK